MALIIYLQDPGGNYSPLYIRSPFFSANFLKKMNLYTMYHGMETKENYCSVNQRYEGILIKCLTLLLEFWNLYFHTLFMQKFWDSNKILKEYIYKHIFNNKRNSIR